MASLFFVVVQLFYISSYTTNAATNCSDICGIVDSDITTFGSRFRRSARETFQYQELLNNSRKRIVNGYDSEPRPWLVFLDVAGGTCGGSVINNRYVLTAAHCFCRQQEPLICKETKTDGKPTHQVAYDVRKHVKLYIGLNDIPLTQKDSDLKFLHPVIDVIIRSGWIFAKTFTPDLALVKVGRKIEFKRGIVAPVCLPPGPHYPDHPSRSGKVFKAYVAGWGAEYSQCDSNLFGPSPHTMCKFPFVYNGILHKSCAHIPPPSSDNEVCKQFHAWAKGKDPNFDPNDRSKVFSVFLWDLKVNKARVTTCYPLLAYESGWCGTCYEGELKPGEEGFCDKYHFGRELKGSSEYGKPIPDANWGWCSDWCKLRGGPKPAKVLQETKLDVLTPKECGHFGTDLEAKPNLELCTGKKTRYSYIYQFKRMVTEDGEITFKPHAKIKNYLGVKDPKYPFYLGGTDACQGDSGGPLIKWNESGGSKRAVIIGVVSRGTGCANFNLPGIYPRVSKQLEWIKENAFKDGDCNE